MRQQEYLEGTERQACIHAEGDFRGNRPMDFQRGFSSYLYDAQDGRKDCGRAIGTSTKHIYGMYAVQSAKLRAAMFGFKLNSALLSRRRQTGTSIYARHRTFVRRLSQVRLQQRCRTALSAEKIVSSSQKSAEYPRFLDIASRHRTFAKSSENKAL